MRLLTVIVVAILAAACACPAAEWVDEAPDGADAIVLTVCLDDSLSAEGRRLMRTAIREWDYALGGLRLIRDESASGDCDVTVLESSTVPEHLGPDVAGWAHDEGALTKWRTVTLFAGRYEGCYRAALHELGHVLGATHSDGDLMSPAGDDCGIIDEDAARQAAEAMGLTAYTWQRQQ